VLAIVAGVGLVALSGLTLGVVRLRHRLRVERERGEAVRAALLARVREDRVREVDRLEATVRELRDRGHEFNNVLSTALLSTELFFDASRADPPLPKADLDSAADGMVEALQRLKGMIAVSRRAETTTLASSSLIQPVELLPAVAACVARARARHPRTVLVLREPDPEARGVRVAVCAGREGFERALDAVLENACEGDGLVAAGRVEVLIVASGSVDVVALEIADDGPGFTRRELSLSITPFESTKPAAQGLGLYTAERIARASGGSLRRVNAEGGGAVVSFFFPVASHAVTPFAPDVVPAQ
jgi:signal transduction histidine kinase